MFNKDYINDTIAAQCSGMTQAGIGVIRISGKDAIDVADKIFLTGAGKKISEFPDNSIRHGFIYDIRKSVPEKTDEVMLSVMRGPHSYTGEDVVEVNCRGGFYITKKILEIIFSTGVRPAEPGEFTKRAFLNGRMDLSEAEAVMSLINSKNEYSLKNSMDQLSGRLKSRIISLRKDILFETAYIESALDDPEHYDLTGYPEKLKEKVTVFLRSISDMKDSYENGRIMQDGVRTAILGKPNAGKSSLLNYISGYDRAIVTDIAGTTRDSIEENVNFGKLQLRLIDTAGIRNADDTVEKIGVERAFDQADKADMIFFVLDSSVPIDENDKKIIEFIKEKNAVIILNKSDLPPVLNENTIKEEISKIFNDDLTESFPIIKISIKTGEGIDELKQLTEKFFENPDHGLNDEIIITNARHKKELDQAYDSLRLVIKSIDDGMQEDFFSIDLMSAYEHLGYIIGEDVGEDLVDEIFSKFCMGK